MAFRGLFSRLGLIATDDRDFKHVRKESFLFQKTTPEVDGEECLKDCDSCQVQYPSKFPIEETKHLYGHVKPWHRHLVVATGASDWVNIYPSIFGVDHRCKQSADHKSRQVRNVTDIKGSVMEAVHGNSGSINHGVFIPQMHNRYVTSTDPLYRD
jgi:hypothetical protein